MPKRGRRWKSLPTNKRRSSTRSVSLSGTEKEEFDEESSSRNSIRSNSSLDEDDYLNATNDTDVESSVIEDVDRCYSEVVAMYEKTIIKEGEELFISMRENKNDVRKMSTAKPASKLKIELSRNGDQPTYFVIRPIFESSVQKCPCRTIDYIAEKPRMRYWTVTESNITCDDEHTLSHIPFLADEEDGEFGEELQNTFPEGIHGTRKGCGLFINDHILHSMLEKLSKIYRSEDDIRKVCRGINAQFPNKATVPQLLSLFSELISRDNVEKSPGEEERPSYSSFQLLSCGRCFTYDCLLHGITQTDNQTQKKDLPVSVTIEPCGPSCYKHGQPCANNGKEAMNGIDGGTKNSKIQLVNGEISWNPLHIDILLALRSTFKTDYCKIARTFNATIGDGASKTCLEIYSYLLQMAPVSPRADVIPRHKSKKKKNMKDKHRLFRSVKWARTEGKVRNSHVYEPCHHPGKCTIENGCSCVRVDNLCTKHCACPENCVHRFPGCRCAPGLCCTKQCQCFYASWECDPDLCKSCRCDNLEDPEALMCKNVSIQRGFQKKLSIGTSQVAGWGCFAEEDIAKNEFISEYCGEVITHDESERRGKIYDKLKCSYLFGLNDELVVDATRKGNLIRFANHSKNPNCKAKVFMVNGDHRIGIFAQTDIKKGEELFFDYSYNAYQQMKFVSKDRPKPA